MLYEKSVKCFKRIKELKKLRQQLAYSSFACKSSWILITSLDFYISSQFSCWFFAILSGKTFKNLSGFCKIHKDMYRGAIPGGAQGAQAPPKLGGRKLRILQKGGAQAPLYSSHTGKMTLFKPFRASMSKKKFWDPPIFGTKWRPWPKL